MLVLTRKKGESIIINENIVVTYLDTDNYGGIRIGISAPSNINIIREELLHRQDWDKKI